MMTWIGMISLGSILLKNGYSFQNSFLSSTNFLLKRISSSGRIMSLLSRKEFRQWNRLKSSVTDEDLTTKSKLINLKGLKAEVTRTYLRSIKKMGKLNERAQKFSIDSPSEETKMAAAATTTAEEKESLEKDILELENRINSLKHLEENLAVIKSSSDPRLNGLLPLINEMKIPVHSGTSQEISSKKTKSTDAPRKPYFVYRSIDGIDIYVGRRAEDNDELSCNPEHRNPNEWWLHVAGFAGSHVVIKNQEENLAELYPETILDAALLAAVNSKAKNSGRVTVSLTRCRNVTKPKGVPAGLVHLTGSIRSVTIDLRSQSSRLERLQRIVFIRICFYSTNVNNHWYFITLFFPCCFFNISGFIWQPTILLQS